MNESVGEGYTHDGKTYTLDLKINFGLRIIAALLVVGVFSFMHALADIGFKGNQQICLMDANTNLIGR
jgi:hypothetical protein